MGVSRCVIRRVCCVIRRVLGLLCRFPCFSINVTYSFISWLFGSMDNSERHYDDGVYESIKEDYNKDNCEETGEMGRANVKQEDDPVTSESLFIAERSPYAVKDMQIFRQKAEEALKLKDLTDEAMDDEENLPNVQFYRNNKQFTPNGVHIDEFHNNWFGEYDRLEYVHTFIQWLFPIQEKGMNYESHELNLQEIKLFNQDPKIKERMLTSYKLMLDFYGIELVNDKTGEVARAKNFLDRFQNLNRNSHNNLRITRILKCLGLLGFSHYQAPLVGFFLEETLEHGTLPRVKQSALDYFIFAVLDKTERQRLIEIACHYKSREVRCPSRTFQDGKEMEYPMNSGGLNKEEIESDAKKDTGVDEAHSSESGNVENVSGVSQGSDTQALLIPDANTADANRDSEAPTYVDLQSVGGSTVQEDGNNEITDTGNLDANANDNAALTDQSKDQNDSNNVKETSNEKPLSSHSSTTESVPNETRPPGISASEQHDRGDNNNEPIVTQPFDTDSGEEAQQRDCESMDDSSTNQEENSADMNRHENTEADKNIVTNPHGDKLDASNKETTEDPVNCASFVKENPKDSLTDVCNDVTSNTDTHSDSKDVKKDGDDTGGVTSSHRNDSDEGKEMTEEQTEMGCVRGGGGEREGNNERL